MLKEEIKEFFEGEIEDGEETLKKYSHDASIFEVRPQIVVFPKHVEDIKNLVKFVRRKREEGDKAISLTARSGGTDMSGGPLNDSIIVDFQRHMNMLKNVTETKDGGTATVQPGMFYRDFEKETLKKNLLIPSYPASREICTVGGMVANNSGGEDTLAYGKTEDYILELKAVLDDGEEHVFSALTDDELETKCAKNDAEGKVYSAMRKLLLDNERMIADAKPNVSKNSAGYFLWNIRNRDHGTFDLTRLIVGSQGTLCFVTEITFRLIRKPEVKKGHSHLAVIFLKDLSELGDIVHEVLAFKPESFESYDDHTLKFAIRFLPDLLKRMKAKNIFSLGWSFIPEMLMMLRGGFPKLVLLAELTGENDEEVHGRLRQLKNVVSSFDVRVRFITRESEARKYWTIRRESFNLLRHHVHGKHTAPFIDDFIVRPEYLSEFLPELNAILDEYKDLMTYTVAGHVGDGNFHIIPLMNLTDKRVREVIPELSEKVYNLVLKYKGSITAEHNDGLIRTPFLRKMYGEKIVQLFAETKRIFDPLNIFNPRKKVGGTMEYGMAHVKSGFEEG